MLLIMGMSKVEIDELRNRFAMVLSQIIDQANMTQKQISQGTGISENSISAWCSGTKTPKPTARLVKILQYIHSKRPDINLLPLFFDGCGDIVPADKKPEVMQALREKNTTIKQQEAQIRELQQELEAEKSKGKAVDTTVPQDFRKYKLPTDFDVVLHNDEFLSIIGNLYQTRNPLFDAAPRKQIDELLELLRKRYGNGPAFHTTDQERVGSYKNVFEPHKKRGG